MSDENGKSSSDFSADQRLAVHEAICAERYKAIIEGLADVKKQISSLRKDAATADAKIEAKVEKNELAIKANSDGIGKLRTNMAYMLGAGAAGAGVGGAIVQMFSG